MDSKLRSICRTCLTESGEFQSIFIPDHSTGSSLDLAQMIMSYTSIRISLGDGLPEDICSSCVQHISNFYLFKKQCEESDITLKNRFGISTCKKPYSIQVQQKLTMQNIYNNECLDIIIKSEFATEDVQDDSKEIKDIIHTEEQFTCGVCNVVLFNDSNIEEHKLMHCDTFKLDCDQREAISTLGSTFDTNVAKLSPEPVPERIPKIEEVTSPNEIEEIVITGTPTLNLFNELRKEIYGCKLCEFLGENETELQNHDCDPSNDSLICNVCGKMFGNSSQLSRHLKIHSSLKPHACMLCGKGFSRAEQLTNHMNMHTGLKPHVCDICSKGFNQISNLKDHMRTHNGDKPFLCSTCGKGFNQLGNLRQHTIRHSGIKAHLCSICGNGFASKGELCAHLRKHTGARPFVCPVCSHGFTTSSSLTKHKRIHSGEKPYECEVCKMRFSRSGILARHRRTHTGEKPYVCKYCTKAFSQSNDLSSHLRIHTGEKPYICDSCGQAFRQSSALKTHKKTHIDKSSLIDSKVVIGMVHHQTLFNTIQ